MPDGIVTQSGRHLDVSGLNLQVPYRLDLGLGDTSFDQLGQMLANFQPRQQTGLQLQFLTPVSRLVGGASLTLFEQTYPRVGPVVVETGVDAATRFFQTGDPSLSATANAEVRTRVWRELWFYVNGEVRITASSSGLEVDHGQFTFGFRLIP